MSGAVTGQGGSSASAGRLFLAAPLDELTHKAITRHLAATLGSQTLPGRVVAPANLHVTLRFLGDTPMAFYTRLVDSLRQADLGPAFDLSFDRLGAFPGPGRARVLWLGIQDGREQLARLADLLERLVCAQGLEPENRPFAAHITLSRLKPERDVRTLLASVPPFELRMPVEQVVLYRSHLAPSGPRYEPLERFALSKLE